MECHKKSPVASATERGGEIIYSRRLTNTSTIIQSYIQEEVMFVHLFGDLLYK